MTGKELQYIEDVLSQEQMLQTSFADFASQLQDPDLKAFVSGLSSQKIECFSKFYSLLNS
jgi:hypothetical protein